MDNGTYLFRQNKRKKTKWQAKTENVRLDDGEGQWTHISGAKGDGTVSRIMEKMVSGTCPWAENLKKKKKICLDISPILTVSVQ